ncbi:1502844a-cb47-4161-9a6d-b0b197795041 [Thermothielavioides terrestris]|uniref:1502844a-cb47-4161-9a6d-b0b197795041 n=1 Tax=Thermothielavioides terrestris TaxID=2587410 RepID=A0A3S4D3X2_9PEZI|nr:1502844a-cb47-4161-9a6d-b0b197795041 [Thermothielavioides terrestris]
MTRFIDRLFREYKHFVHAYIDDIIIANKNIEEYLKHVETVLDILDKELVEEYEKAYPID